MQELVTGITNLGFSVVMCLLLLKELRETRAAHKEESEKWVEAFEKSIAVMTSVESKTDFLIGLMGKEKPHE